MSSQRARRNEWLLSVNKARQGTHKSWSKLVGVLWVRFNGAPEPPSARRKPEHPQPSSSIETLLLLSPAAAPVHLSTSSFQPSRLPVSLYSLSIRPQVTPLLRVSSSIPLNPQQKDLGRTHRAWSFHLDTPVLATHNKQHTPFTTLCTRDTAAVSCLRQRLGPSQPQIQHQVLSQHAFLHRDQPRGCICTCIRNLPNVTNN